MDGVTIADVRLHGMYFRSGLHAGLPIQATRHTGQDDGLRAHLDFRAEQCEAQGLGLLGLSG